MNVDVGHRAETGVTSSMTDGSGGIGVAVLRTSYVQNNFFLHCSGDKMFLDIRVCGRELRRCMR